MTARADPPICVIAGPTASGKTARGVELALEVGGEVISADSRQLFRGMAIGTAAPTPDEQRGIAHHFVAERDPAEGPYSAGAFARAAEERIAAVLARGRVPIVVGGTGFYIRALALGLSEMPSVPAEVRETLNAELRADGLATLVAELRAHDPVLAAGLDLRNPARVLRGLEVVRATGIPLSEWQRRPPAPPRYRYAIDVLQPDPHAHREAIERRTQAMLDRGLLDETARLLDAGLPDDSEVLRTIGYREAVAFLHTGIPADPCRLAEAISLSTWQYARRQKTYFRKLVLDLQ